MPTASSQPLPIPVGSPLDVSDLVRQEQTPATKTIDERAQLIVDAVEDGTITEDHGRRALATLAFVSNIHDDTAHRARGIRTLTARGDIADSLLELSLDKILVAGKGSYDFSRTGSFCGFVRNLQRAAIGSKVRDYRRRHKDADERDLEAFARHHRSADTEDSIWDVYTEPEASAEDVVMAGPADERDYISVMRSSASEPERLAALSKAVVEATGAPYLLRLYDERDRKWLHRAVKREPDLAFEGLIAYGQLVTGGDSGDIDDRLLAVWDDYAASDVDALLAENDPRKVASMVLAASGELVRPNQDGCARMVKFLTGNAKRTDPFIPVARALVDAFLAREAGTINPHFQAKPDELTALQRQRRAEAADWEAALGDALGYPGSPLGTSGDDLYELLVVLHRHIQHAGPKPTHPGEAR